MFDDFFSREKIRRPEILLNEFLRKGIKGLFRQKTESPVFLYRAVVLAVDEQGGKLENPDGSGTLTHIIDGKKENIEAREGPKNPKNSIRARLLSNGEDKFSFDNRLRIYWPMFDMQTIKPGEHVYVTFEDEEKNHGLWISKVAGHDDLNFAEGSEYQVTGNEDSKTNKFPDTAGLKDKNSKDFSKDSVSSESPKKGNLKNVVK